MGLFDIFKSRERRNYETIQQIAREMAKPTGRQKIESATATISTHKLNEDIIPFCAEASAELVLKVISLSGHQIDSESEMYGAGLFCFIFCNHFTYITGSDFEVASGLALLILIGHENGTDMLPLVIQDYNDLCQSNADIIKVIGTSCAMWVEKPSLDILHSMAKIYDHVVGGKNT